MFFLLLFQFDVTSILYRPHWHAQYQARSNDIHCNFHFELSVVLYFIPCNFETRSLGQRFGFVILQICIVFIVSLSSTWKTIYICVVCLFIWVSCDVFFTFLLKHMTIVFIFDICTMSFTNFYFLFFSPGKYYPMLVFFAIHIIMMTTLHYIFSDAKLYWQKGGFMNFSFFHYMLGNGLANIYIHNWIRMDPLLIKDRKPLQHVATLVRQGCFDLVLVVENVVLLWIALHSEINELKDNRLAFSSVLLGFTLIGLILKWVYYRYVSTIYYIN